MNGTESDRANNSNNLPPLASSAKVAKVDGSAAGESRSTSPAGSNPIAAPTTIAEESLPVSSSPTKKKKKTKRFKGEINRNASPSSTTGGLDGEGGDEYASDNNLLASDQQPPSSPSPVENNATEELSPTGKLIKKKKRIQVVSPVTGEKILVSSEDLIKSLDDMSTSQTSLDQVSSKKSKKGAKSGTGNDLPSSGFESVNLNSNTAPVGGYQQLRDEAEITIIKPTLTNNNVVFVSDGGKFNAIDAATYKQKKLVEQFAMPAQDIKAESFSERFLRRRKYIFDFAMSLYAGLCLCTLLLLPSSSTFSSSPIVPYGDCAYYPPVPVISVTSEIPVVGQYPMPLVYCDVFPATTFNTTTAFTQGSVGDSGQLFSFLYFYSPNSFNINVLFQVAASLGFVATWENAINLGMAKKLGGSRKLEVVLGWASVITMATSFAGTILMIYTDTNLYMSAQAGSQGSPPPYGLYGQQYWFFNSFALQDSTLRANISSWAVCNTIRAIFGLISCCLWLLLQNLRNDQVTAIQQQRAQPGVMRPSSSNATIMRGVGIA